LLDHTFLHIIALRIESNTIDTCKAISTGFQKHFNKFSDDFTIKCRRRRSIIFEKYPSILEAYDRVRDFDIDATTCTLFEIQKTMARSLFKNCSTLSDYGFGLLDRQGPISPDQKPDYKILKEQGIDTVLEVGVKRLGFEGGKGNNPSMPIPLNPAGCSAPKRPLVPIETGHPLSERSDAGVDRLFT
jgi:hypothetical protein